MLKLIIFDFDGTLINSVPDLTASINYMYSIYGLNEVKEELVAKPSESLTLKAKTDTKQTTINKNFLIISNPLNNLNKKEGFSKMVNNII
jgi:phosphoglycolate phosphatase-like HAD superfamily hydrolase